MRDTFYSDLNKRKPAVVVARVGDIFPQSQPRFNQWLATDYLLAKNIGGRWKLYRRASEALEKSGALQ